MREKVAVVTVQGKPYFLIVNQLKKHNIPFVSVVPGQPLPSKVKVVITTEQEKPLVNYEKTLVFTGDNELDNLINEVKKSLLGKEAYEKIVVGLDPGEATGLVVLADGKIIEESNCFSHHEVISTIQKNLRNIDFTQTAVTIKIGNGVPIYRELLQELDESLPSPVVLEIVGEFGTNKPLKEHKHSRKIRHISSATRIAGRVGRRVERRKMVAANSAG